jgi:hypothetical protein
MSADAASPSAGETLEARAKWFSLARISNSRGRWPSQFSTQGLLLVLDVERAFVGGAWLSTIVLAQAAIEATIRDIETQDYESKAKALFDGLPNLERIRELRNEIVHPLKAGSKSLVWATTHDVAGCHDALEADAKRAVELMFNVVYGSGRSRLR